MSDMVSSQARTLGDETMIELWNRMDAWSQGSSGPGASDAEIAEAEDALGVRLPEDLRVSFALRNPLWLPTRDENLALQDVVAVWQHLCGTWTENNRGRGSIPSGPIKPDWWNARWIPVTFNQGNCYFVDLDPAPGGNAGQVVSYDIEGPRTQLMAPSFRGWLEQFLDDFDRIRRFLADADNRARLERLTEADVSSGPLAKVAGEGELLRVYFKPIAQSHESPAAYKENFPGFLARFREFVELLEQDTHGTPQEA